MSEDTNAEEFVDIATALGADGGVSTQCFSLYVPNKDQHGVEIGNQRQWVLDAKALLCEINRGATVMPAVEGGWINDEGEAVWENPIVVYSFIRVDAFVANLPRLRAFLHRLGRETNQGEIVFELGDRMFHIRNFDEK